jgi:phage shock protein A
MESNSNNYYGEVSLFILKKEYHGAKKELEEMVNSQKAGHFGSRNEEQLQKYIKRLEDKVNTLKAEFAQRFHSQGIRKALGKAKKSKSKSNLSISKNDSISKK